MFTVTGRSGVVVQSQRLSECIRWLTSKAAEYSRSDWMPGTGREIIRLGTPSEEFTLSRTHDVWKWVVTVPQEATRDGGIAADKVIGICDDFDAAKRSVEMTYGKVIMSPVGEMPADLYQFSASSGVGTVQRVVLSHEPAKLPR